MLSRTNAPDILHLVEHQKFIPPLIRLVEEKLDFRRHHFYFIHNGNQYDEESQVKVTKNGNRKNIIQFIWHLARHAWFAEKIIIHGLFSSKLILALVLQPWLWQKCYWVMWGGDLYTYALDKRTWTWWIKELFRKILIPNLGHLLTYIPGDVKLVRQWYGAKGVHHECLMYPSNTYQATPVILAFHEDFNILIGNSADSSNNHAEIIHKIKKLNKSNIKIVAPLSYGEKDYANKVAELGASEFGGGFTALMNFMSSEEYSKILANIDVAIFNHRRQQGMGNIISLLGMGKTVAIRSDISTWQYLKNIGLKLHDTLNLDLTVLSVEDVERNKKIIQEKFSIDLLVSQYRNILEVNGYIKNE
jgi:dTDP-N-acetylfucosamine:lipid II N-acetylfucosaminyltransferase